MNTDTPAAVYEIDTDSDAGQHLVKTLSLSEGDAVEWGEDGECPDDLRSTLYGTVSNAFQAQVAGWHLLPRWVQHSGPKLRIRMEPENLVAPEDNPEPPPRVRVLEMMDEYHEEHREDTVPRGAIMRETQGTEATIHEALDKLERVGKIYQPTAAQYRRTRWS